MGILLDFPPPEDWYGGAVAVAAVIGILFLLSRVAYVRDVKRRRRMTPWERRAERGSDDPPPYDSHHQG